MHWSRWNGAAGVLICHLDDGKANALSNDMIIAISGAIAEAEGDDSIHAVVLHGREGKFSAGFDLTVMLAGDMAAMTDLVANGGELCRSIYAAKVPVVAACTGHALAAGALILLACDVRIGADQPCKIGLNEVAIGMTLPDWALTLAGERLSKRHLQRAIPTARITDASGAVDAGYLDEAGRPGCGARRGDCSGHRVRSSRQQGLCGDDPKDARCSSCPDGRTNRR